MTLIGHNSGDLPTVMATRYTELTKRRDQLLSSMARVPVVIESDEVQKKVSDLAVMIAECIKQSEAAREAEKAPFLEGGRAVDGFFTGTIKEPLDEARKKLLRLGGEYLRKKKEDELAARQKEIDEAAERSRAALEAAESLEKKGHAALSEKLLNEAAASEVTALAGERELQKATAGDLVRTRSSMGALSTLKESWVCQSYLRDVVDLEKLRPHLGDDAIRKAIASWIKANKSALEADEVKLNGATIVKQADAVYRR